MKTLVKLRWDGAMHPLLEGLQVDATAEGAAATVARCADREMWFLLDDGAQTFTVTLSFAGDHAAIVRALTEDKGALMALDALTAAQEQELARASTALRRARWRAAWRAAGTWAVTATGLRAAAPRSSSAASATDLVARADTRVVGPDDAAASQGAGSVTAIDLDLAFLDVSEALDNPWQIAWSNTDGCAVRVYQYTGADGASACNVVAVLVPPALRSGTPPRRLDTLTFFCPASGHYADAFDANTTQLYRYIHRFGPQRDPFGYFSDDPMYASALGAYPPCRFGAQLANSRRRVALVMPFANGADMSPMQGSSWTHRRRRARSLLASLTRALRADGNLAGGARAGGALDVGRVGVAGFSLGGAAALHCFRANREHVGELYLFDPNGFTPGSSAQAEVRRWAAHPGRRLRLVGGMHIDAMAAFARSLCEELGGDLPDTSHDRRPARLTADATVMMLPTTPAFFDRSADYAAAFASELDPRTTPWNAPTPGSLTRSHGVFAEPHAPGDTPAFRAVFADGTRSEVARFEAMAFVEAEHRLWVQAEPGQRFTRASWARAVRAVTHPSGGGLPMPGAMRHQWTVFGGQSATDRHDDSFMGYLQLCLETSAFAR